jgi:phosphate transport system permease protein
VTQIAAPTGVNLGRKGRGTSSDRAFSGLSLGSGMLVLAILALILLTTLKEAWPALRYAGFGFVTGADWIPLEVNGHGPVYGALSFVYGTGLTSIIALIFAVPVSVGIALFLTELAPLRLRSTVVTIIDLLASIPSVVFGLWGIIVVGPVLVKAYKGVHGGLGSIPLVGKWITKVFGEPITTGRSFMTAGIIVAIMIIPIITSITREVFATVPDSDKQAAYALGATQWEMIKGAVFPHSFGGMVGGIMLGLGRAMGETIAVALTIGAATQITPNLFASGNSLASVIALNFGDPGIPPGRSALIACGVLLFAITILINYAAELIVRRAEIRMRGAAR